MKHSKWSDFEYCLAAVQENSYALRYIEEQNPEICLAAVQENGYALQFVKEQTPEICMAAVQENARGLKYVEHQTPEICVAAIKQNPDTAEYIRLPENGKQRAVFLKELIFLMNAEELDTEILKNLKEQL